MRLTEMDRALFWGTAMSHMLHIIVYEWRFIIAKLLVLTFFIGGKRHTNYCRVYIINLSSLTFYFFI